MAAPSLQQTRNGIYRAQAPSFLVRYKTLNDKQQIANEFNKYFVNIGSSLAQSVPNNQNIPSYRSYLKGDFVNSFSLFLTTPDEICSVVAVMPPETTAMLDRMASLCN